MAKVNNPQDESAVVRAAQMGGAEEFARLVELYDRRLLYFVRRMLGEEHGAFDVMQVVWLIVYRRISSLRSIDGFRSWVYRIAHDQAVTEVRRRGRHLDMPVESLPESAWDDSHSAELHLERIDLVHRGLSELSFEHRRVLTLKFLEDMSIEQIAEVIGAQSGTVKSRLHYAKSALRRWIEEQGS